MKHLFIINPAAGKYDHTKEFTAAIESAFSRRDAEYEISVSRHPGDCAAAARAACQSGGPLRIYACGGDGTLNEVVNGAAGFPNAAVTHWPSGSGNDFIKIFSEPSAFSSLEGLLDGSEAAFDLIQVGDHHYALNVCSMGFDARIGTEIAAYKRLPLVTGKGAYFLSAAVNTIKGVHQPYEVELDSGERIGGRQSLICILNGRWYGGSFNPVPEAEPDDGLLDVLVVKAVSRLTVARVIWMYKNGRYAQYPELISHYRCRSLRIRCPKPSAVNLDGELLTESDVTVRISDYKIRFFYPKALTWNCKSKKFASNSV